MSMEFHGAVLKSLRVEGVQSGLILSAQLFVELENRAKDEATEVVLRFRSLPSAIWKFVANVGSREIFSQVVEKNRGVAAYDNAVSSNQTPVMCEQQDNNSFELALGLLHPQEWCNVRLWIDQDLTTTDDGSLLIELPYVCFGASVVDLTLDSLCRVQV
jgi:hypothetical protein